MQEGNLPEQYDKKLLAAMDADAMGWPRRYLLGDSWLDPKECGLMVSTTSVGNWPRQDRALACHFSEAVEIRSGNLSPGKVSGHSGYRKTLLSRLVAS
jgi:hypothetical protein